MARGRHRALGDLPTPAIAPVRPRLGVCQRRLRPVEQQHAGKRQARQAVAARHAVVGQGALRAGDSARLAVLLVGYRRRREGVGGKEGRGDFGSGAGAGPVKLLDGHGHGYRHSSGAGRRAAGPEPHRRAGRSRAPAAAAPPCSGPALLGRQNIGILVLERVAEGWFNSTVEAAGGKGTSPTYHRKIKQLQCF
ncbi:hypothetical protein V496_00846 [Pseudogymnoascus sp. VKM F-4515 (FW-2607)]|nr:hypothetical protein V496_00846 [Pseudogymnoascus sp. VKM F-4515 (FW-2607)]